ncbi:MAG: hypothetical protein HDR22_04295 [Lachnospiraceae bacterium]|nr:hypothetical protein [Lachnospiraceae bacterium]
MMSRIREILSLCIYEFRIQFTSKRVWLGYLVGIVIILKQSVEYLAYADSTGEAVNVLDAFIIAGNNYNTVMFLVLGWLLVISEAPFVDNNSAYVIYRTQRKNWNKAMGLYVLLQAVIYYGILAVSTILFSCRNGFFANIWSKPLMRLAGNGINVQQYNVSFPYSSFMQETTVLAGFLQTWLLIFTYGLIMGLLLYTFSLFSNQIAGVIVVFLFHFLGYEIMKEGFMMIIKYSLLARSILVLQVGSDTGTNVFETYLIYGILILLILGLSGRLVKYVDFRDISKGE